MILKEIIHLKNNKIINYNNKIINYNKITNYNKIINSKEKFYLKLLKNIVLIQILILKNKLKNICSSLQNIKLPIKVKSKGLKSLICLCLICSLLRINKKDHVCLEIIQQKSILHN